MRLGLKRAFKWTGIGLGGLLLLTAAASVGGRYWLASDSGRAFLAGLAQDAGVDLAGLEGDPFGRLTVERARVLDAEGAWLTVEDAAFAWRPWALLGGVVKVEELVARRVAVDRAPASGPEPAPEPEGAGFQPPPIAVEIDRLAVAEIALAEALAGTAARLGLDARARYADGEAAVDLAVDRLDAPGRLALDAAYRLAENALDMELVASEPPGGLATNLLGLADGIEVRLNGAGDLARWQGALIARSGAAELADLAIDLARADAAGADVLRIGVEGGLAPGPLLPEAFRPLAGDDVAIDLAAAVGLDGGPIVLELLEVDAAAAAIAAEGRYDPETGAVDATVETRRIAPEAIAQFAPDVAVTAPALTARIGGTLDALEATVTARAEAARMGEIAADDIAADVHARLGAGFQPAEAAVEARVGALRMGGIAVDDVALDAAATPVSDTDGALQWRADVDAGAIALGDPALDPLLAGAWSVRGSGVYDPAAERLPLQVRIAGASGVDVGFEGTVSPAGAATGRLTADLADLAPVSDLAGMPLSGPGTITADIAYGDAGLALSNIDVRALDVSVSGQVSLNDRLDQVEGEFRIRAPDLGRLAALVAAPVDGALAADIALSGSLDDLRSSGEIRFDPLVAAGQRFASARIAYSAQSLLQAPRGTVEIRAASPYGPLQAATAFRLADGRLALGDLAVAAPGAEATGAIALDLATTLATGALRIAARSLAEAAAPFGLDLAGAGGGEIRLSAGSGGAQRIEANLAFDDVAGFGVTADSLDLAAAGGIGGDAALDVTLTARNAGVAGATAETLRLTLEGPLDDAGVRLAAAGEAAAAPFAVDLAGRLSVTDAGQRFRLTDGEGSFADAPFTLAPGLVVTNDASGIAVTGLDLNSDPIALEAGVALADGRIDLDLRRLDADLTELAALAPELPLAGRVSASGAIQGPLSAPEGRITLTGRDLRAVAENGMPTFDVDGVLAAQDRRLSFDLTARGLGQQPLTVAGAVGLAAGPDGIAAPGPESPIELRVAWSGQARALMALAPIDDIRLSGPVDIDISVDGTLARPNARGGVTLGPGRFEHLEYGTDLRFEEVEVVADGPAIELRPFRARAGGGVVVAEGRARLDAPGGPEFELNARLDEARVVARDDVTATIGGTLDVESGDDGILVTARLRTEDVQVELIGDLPPSIPVLEVTEVGRTPEGRVAEREKEEEDEGPAAGPPILLDIVVDIPGRLYVRGRGLEAEWEGRIAITGTASDPVVNGLLTLRRGSFDVAGKRLNLTEGSIRIEPDASGRLEAVIDILAEFEGADFSAGVRITGPATDPEIILFSTPDLPRDEILSRLLFNKNAGALTTEESIQLAAAVASLTSGGGGFDPIGRLRRALGVDTLRVDLGPSGTPTVEAGKYLTDDIYLGVRQGTGQDGGTAVEVELFDNFTIESEVLPDGSQSVGGRIKWDY